MQAIAQSIDNGLDMCFKNCFLFEKLEVNSGKVSYQIKNFYPQLKKPGIPENEVIEPDPFITFDPLVNLPICRSFRSSDGQEKNHHLNLVFKLLGSLISRPVKAQASPY